MHQLLNAIIVLLVFQLDFPTKILLIIHRGHIKKSESFQSLLYYESEVSRNSYAVFIIQHIQ